MPKNLLEKTRQKLRDAGFARESFSTSRSGPTGGVYVFFSFDLVNSTAFKATAPKEWPLVVIRFYELVQAEITTRLDSTVLWKYAGDEILYYLKIRKIIQLHDLLPKLLSALKAVLASLYAFNQSTRQVLSVKSAVWIAEAAELPSTSVKNLPELSTRNIITTIRDQSERTSKDFLGPDIDAGFRISKFVERERLVVSAELAAILFEERAQCKGIDNQLKIVSYELLKGVWEGRRYPIIWFEESWDDIEQKFLYDEHLNSNLVAEIKRSKLKNPENQLSAIKKVYSDLDKMGEIKKLIELLKLPDSSGDENVVEIEVPLHKRSELHCVAACFDERGRVLVGKRPNTKKRFAGKWELGCSQLKLGETFGECLRGAYYQDFSAELDLPDNPIPVASFSIKDEGERRFIPGLIFAASVKNAAEVERRFLTEKHTEIRWVDPRDSNLRPEDCVPDLLENVRKAWVALTNQ